MIINVHGGHSLKCRGASGLLDEVNEDRKVKNKVIELLRANGHTVYDCTDDNGKDQNSNLKAIVNKCNDHKVDLDVSIHLNAGGGTGTEVYVYSDNSKAKDEAERIVKNISNTLGIRNRGVKTSTKLYVLRKTNSPALLVECCFVDNVTDKAKWNADKCAKAIVEGITGAKVEETHAQPKPQPQKPTNNDNWTDRLNAEIKRQGFKTYPVVKKGAKGGITKLIQERLNSVGFNLVCDGIFGEATKRDVIVFQRNRGLTADGIVGANTWAWLLKGTKM